jgi:hypothetical protein
MKRAILHKDLQLSKKSARLVTKILYEEMWKEQLRMFEAVMARVAMPSCP